MEDSISNPAFHATDVNKITDNDANVDRAYSPSRQWIRFEEDNSKESVATIVPTQTIQVDSILNTSHPLTDSLGSVESEVTPDPKLVAERSSSPLHSGFITGGRTSPKTPIPPPPVQSRAVRKSPTELTRSSCPPEIGRDNGHSMQNIPLSENAVHQRQINSHGIRQEFSKF